MLRAKKDGEECRTRCRWREMQSEAAVGVT